MQRSRCRSGVVAWTPPQPRPRPHGLAAGRLPVDPCPSTPCAGAASVRLSRHRNRKMADADGRWGQCRCGPELRSFVSRIPRFPWHSSTSLSLNRPPSRRLAPRSAEASACCSSWRLAATSRPASTRASSPRASSRWKRSECSASNAAASCGADTPVCAPPKAAGKIAECEVASGSGSSRSWITCRFEARFGFWRGLADEAVAR